MAGETSRSWFAVFYNPLEHGYTGEPVDVCNRLMAEWCVTDTRVGAWAYCIKHYVGCFPVYADDDSGHKKPIAYRKAITEEEKAMVPEDLHHVHMVLEDEKPMRFTVIRKTYAIGSHFEETKGTRKQAEDYISKTGDFDERGKKEAGLPWEEVMYVARKGDIRGRQGQKSAIEEIGTMLEAGMTPIQILRKDIRYYCHEATIRKAYFDKCVRETPFFRDVLVCWHTGASGSGKSYCRKELVDCYGEDDVFYMTNFDPRTRFDGYSGQRILWMEDYKGGISYADMLRILDGYKVTLSARYANVVGIWREVHISSIFHPKAIYWKMVEETDIRVDVEEQFLRRITLIRYHYKTEEGGQTQYKYMDFPPQTLVSEMQMRIAQYEKAELFRNNPELKEVPPGEELPF